MNCASGRGGSTVTGTPPLANSAQIRAPLRAPRPDQICDPNVSAEVRAHGLDERLDVQRFFGYVKFT